MIRIFNLNLYWEDLPVVFLFTLVLRALVWSHIAHHPVQGDELRYWQQAQHMLKERYVERGYLPVWPYVLSKALKIDNHPYTGRILVSFIAATSAVFVFLLAHQFFDRRTAWLAAVLYAIYPEHIAFSHYLYGEMLLELFILISTYFVLVSIHSNLKKRWLFLGFFILGIGMISKHFAIVTYAALVLTIYVHRKAMPFYKGAIISLSFFLVPVGYFSKVAWAGQDGLSFLNLPIKNAHEWYQEGFFPGYRGRTKMQTMKEFVAKKERTHASVHFIRFKENFSNFWGPNSYPIGRIIHQKYRLKDPWVFVSILACFHIALVLLGSIGLLGHRGVFAVYSFASFLILAGMGFLWWMVSRYRISFMFIMIIHAAYVLGRPALVYSTIRTTKKQWLFLGLLMLNLLVAGSGIRFLNQKYQKIKLAKAEKLFPHEKQTDPSR